MNVSGINAAMQKTVGFRGVNRELVTPTGEFEDLAKRIADRENVSEDNIYPVIEDGFMELWAYTFLPAGRGDFLTGRDVADEWSKIPFEGREDFAMKIKEAVDAEEAALVAKL